MKLVLFNMNIFIVYYIKYVFILDENLNSFIIE